MSCPPTCPRRSEVHVSGQRTCNCELPLVHQRLQHGIWYNFWGFFLDYFCFMTVQVWSAPNYCYRCGNVASILSFNDNMVLLLNFILFYFFVGLSLDISSASSLFPLHCYRAIPKFLRLLSCLPYIIEKVSTLGYFFIEWKHIFNLTWSSFILPLFTSP